MLRDVTAGFEIVGRSMRTIGVQPIFNAAVGIIFLLALAHQPWVAGPLIFAATALAKAKPPE